MLRVHPAKDANSAASWRRVWGMVSCSTCSFYFTSQSVKFKLLGHERKYRLIGEPLLDALLCCCNETALKGTPHLPIIFTN